MQKHLHGHGKSVAERNVQRCDLPHSPTNPFVVTHVISDQDHGEGHSGDYPMHVVQTFWTMLRGATNYCSAASEMNFIDTHCHFDMILPRLAKQEQAA
eukprot:6446993-Amphidinium_carterae.1